MNNPKKIWENLCLRMHKWNVNWKEEVAATSVVHQLIKRRSNNNKFSDKDIFEGILLGILSNNTDWRKIKKIKNELKIKFNDFDLKSYSQNSEKYITETIIPWFVSNKSGSLTLKKDLHNLIYTSKKLAKYSDENGSADQYFTVALSEAKKDVIELAISLGTDTKWKLKGFGVPLAAEALRNIGYNLSKPDRHILRAVGSLQLVNFDSWENEERIGRNSPPASISNLREAMKAVDELAKENKEETTFVDSVIWTACAKGGAWLTNEELTEIGKHSRM